jgi:hypothetical protein
MPGPFQCPECGATVSDSVVACRRCGARLVAETVVALLEAGRRRRAIAQEALGATLTGLTRVNVQVEPLNTDAERDGLTRADLQTEVESALRQAGIDVVNQTELFANVPGAPFLHLDVMTCRLDGSYAYSVRLELWQAVRLIRDPAIQAPALTWSSPQVVGTVAADRLPAVRHAVRSAVDAFVHNLAAERS